MIILLVVILLVVVISAYLQYRCIQWVMAVLNLLLQITEEKPQDG